MSDDKDDRAKRARAMATENLKPAPPQARTWEDFLPPALPPSGFQGPSNIINNPAPDTKLSDQARKDADLALAKSFQRPAPEEKFQSLLQPPPPTQAARPERPPAPEEGFATSRNGVALDAPKPAAAAPPRSGPPEIPVTTAPVGGGTGSRILELPAGLGRMGGAGGVMVPGGMHPESVGVQHQQGHRAPAEAQLALAGATALRTDAAQQQRNADVALYKQVADQTATKLAANDAALAQHQQVQVERQAEVTRRLAEIEDLNSQANAKITNPWQDRSTAARVIGAIAMGLGGFGARSTGGRNIVADQIQAGINREIEVQLANQKGAQQKVGHATNLLKLHLDAWGDEDKAIDATKLALYDNALTQMEKYKADHMAQVSDAQFSTAVAGVLEKRAEVVAKLQARAEGETTNEYHEKWAPPKMVGGVGLGMNNKILDDFFKEHKEGDTIALPEFQGNPEVRVSIHNPAVATEINKAAGITGSIHAINRRASDLLGKLDKLGPLDFAERREVAIQLKMLAEQKSALSSVQVKQGVLKEAEYWRALTNTVGWSGDLMSLEQALPAERRRIQRFLRHQDVQAYNNLTKEVQAASGSEVSHRYAQDPRRPKGDLTKVQFEKGANFQAKPIPAPMEPIE